MNYKNITMYRTPVGTSTLLEIADLKRLISDIESFAADEELSDGPIRLSVGTAYFVLEQALRISRAQQAAMDGKSGKMTRIVTGNPDYSRRAKV